MSVTLDVSRLSGWLNAYAFCRVEGKAWEEDNMRAGRLWRFGGGGGKQCAGEIQTEDEERVMRGAHLEHVLHICDTGRVEAQRLVERTRILPS